MTCRALRFLAFPALLLLAQLGCWDGGHASSGGVGTANQVLTITPDAASVMSGQTLQFSAKTPWGNSVTWSVQPATGGTINAAGLFTAGATPGQCLVLAMWNDDVRYAASAQVTILPPPVITSAGFTVKPVTTNAIPTR